MQVLNEEVAIAWSRQVIAADKAHPRLARTECRARWSGLSALRTMGFRNHEAKVCLAEQRFRKS